MDGGERSGRGEKMEQKASSVFSTLKAKIGPFSIPKIAKNDICGLA